MTQAARYQYKPLPFTQVTIDDAFWSPRIETNRTVTIGYDFQKSEETGRHTNFDKAAGRMAGDHEGIFFNDSDVFKIIEGAAYSLNIHPDPELDGYLDNLIERIAAAQEPDGYLYTARTIAERNGTPEKMRADVEGVTRWSHLRVNHELYNVGHLYEAAVAHYLATGKRSLLDVALKNADLVERVFGPGKKHDVPGHQEIEMGLVKLYGVTGDERYLRLAKFFLDERGHHEQRPAQTNFDNAGYMQDHRPVTEQDEAVGHAVRALYMYCGMADVAALTGEQAYIDAIDRIWENVVGKKFYITGGLGARHHGEAFGDNYELPNATAYNETCAAIANVFWNQRMFQLHGEAKYIDVLERSLYNGFLPGVAFSGDKFFYVNPLSFDGEYRFNRDNSNERLGWFNCSCCPTNVVRVFPSLGSYIYAQAAERVYVNLFISSQTALTVGGTAVKLTQSTHYPWDGTIQLTVQPAAPTAFTLALRIPGWAQGQPVPSDLYHYVDAEAEAPVIRVNGEPIPLVLEKGYAQITRVWQADDRIELVLPMPVRRVVSRPAVPETVGKVAVERGPLVYCAEAVDHDGPILRATLADNAPLTITFVPDLLNGITVIQANQRTGNLTLVPYYAWAHRGIGAMTVWFDRTT
jgi:DUF1680 family protein